MRAFATVPIVVAAAVLAAGCGDPVGPDDLTVDLEIVPDHVAPGDSLSARATITNPTADTVRMTPSSCAGLWRHRAFRDGEPVGLDGLIIDPGRILCIVAPVSVEVAPGASLSYEWPFRASVDGVGVAAGEYRVRFEPLVEGLDGAEDTFTVGMAFPAR